VRRDGLHHPRLASFRAENGIVASKATI